jgi:hypothetical protein
MYLAIAVVLMTCMIQVSEAKSAEEYFDRPVRLAAVSLSVKTIKDIYRWWNDEISGGECGKNFFKNSAESGGFIAGSYIGALIAKYLFPWIPDAATFIGECVGGLFGMVMTHYLIDSLANNSPKYVVLKEAYEFLELKENASNYDINQSFFRLVNKFKLGTDNFQKLQFYMQVIRISKGESF